MLSGLPTVFLMIFVQLAPFPSTVFSSPGGLKANEIQLCCNVLTNPVPGMLGTPWLQAAALLIVSVSA
jgi:hypothetical protein